MSAILPITNIIGAPVQGASSPLRGPQGDLLPAEKTTEQEPSLTKDSKESLRKQNEIMASALGPFPQPTPTKPIAVSMASQDDGCESTTWNLSKTFVKYATDPVQDSDVPSTISVRLPSQAMFEVNEDSYDVLPCLDHPDLSEDASRNPRTDFPLFQPKYDQNVQGDTRLFQKSPVDVQDLLDVAIATPMEPSELDCITVARPLRSTGAAVRTDLAAKNSEDRNESNNVFQTPEGRTATLQAGLSNAPNPDHPPQRRVVILKIDPHKLSLGSFLKRDTIPTGTSTNFRIPTPPDSHASSGEEIPLETPNPSKKRKRYPEGQLSPGLYGRAPNPRRAATKGYRGSTPPTKSQQKVEVADDDGMSTYSEKPAIPGECSMSEGSAKGKPHKGFKDFQKPISNNESLHCHPTVRGVSTVQPEHMSSLLQAAFVEPVCDPLRPVCDTNGYRRFVENLLPTLEFRSMSKRKDMGKRQASRILDLLRRAQCPEGGDALFLSTEEASEWLRPGKFCESIIVTNGQQGLPLQTVEQFLDEFYEDKAQVWVQDPKVYPSKGSQIVKQIKIGAVKQRLLSGQPTDRPWNLLELGTHCDDGLRPAFLNTEDSRLLTKLKIPNAADHTRRRVYEQGYREVEKWALLAEAGALTEPHQDSHGYSTFITINQGLVGFGWLCKPTSEERKQWRSSPSSFAGGRWRYVVLQPGQTVYFPAGTVHFVFRSPHTGHTLAFGGHVLRCSTIVQWVQTLIEERDAKEITNEDLTDSASGYLERVEKFVHHARVTGTEEKWGGRAAIEGFLELKKEFTKKKQSRS